MTGTRSPAVTAPVSTVVWGTLALVLGAAAGAATASTYSRLTR